MDFTFRKPLKDKCDGWINIFDLDGDEFMALMDELENTRALFNRFKSWDDKKKVFFKRLSDNKEKLDG